MKKQIIFYVCVLLFPRLLLGEEATVLPSALIDPAPIIHVLKERPVAPETAGPIKAPRPVDEPSVEPVPALEKDEEDANRPKTEEELMDERIEGVNREKEFLAAQNQLFDERLKKELAELRAEKERIATDLSLAQEKSRQSLAARNREISLLKLEKEELSTKATLARTRADLRHDAEIAGLKRQEEKLKLENALQHATFAKTRNELQQKEAKIKAERMQLDFEILKMDHRLRQRTKAEELADMADRDRIEYSSKPLQGKTLVLSDRIISLNGPIWYETSDYVSERINYFNNKSSEYPIFLVIDYSPGGSVMSGYKILKAMHGSKAPVHVLVKSFAASMAAAITTLADVSYAYPNAIILHHQLSYGMGGNLTQQSESLDDAAEWYKRLSQPIADKMGVTLEALVEQMYENNSDGDWGEFADVAKGLKWVDHIVEEVHETARLKNPDRQVTSSFLVFGSKEEADEKGRPFMRLPRIQPFDSWWMHNPDGYYRTWMD